MILVFHLFSQIQTLVADKGDLENELNILNNKLASALSDCNSKDELAKKHEKMTMEAVAGIYIFSLSFAVS